MQWIFIVFATSCIFCSCKAQATLAPLVGNISSERAIRESYFVVLKRDAKEDAVKSHLGAVRSLISASVRASAISREGRARNVTRRPNITAEISIGTLFRGYTAILTDDLLNRVRAMDVVDFVEVDQKVKTAAFTPQCSVQCNPPWGIVRTTTSPPPTSNSYVYNPDTSGSGVDIYVIDTGIDTTHPDFGGRASFGINFASDFSTGDPHGHGTHVAGIAMSNTYGVAKAANAISVRVLDSFGFGSYSAISQGIDWVVQQCCTVVGPGPCNQCDEVCVINMSLEGPTSAAVNMLTNAAVQAGVHVAVAAGNSFVDACQITPAGAVDAVTVAASDCDDFFAFFSNHGKCVDIIAPGVDILSTAPSGGTAVLSGTSQATPHVAGVMAKYLSYYLFEGKVLPCPIQLREVLINTASANRITFVPQCTLNLLVFKECLTTPLCFDG